jgi:ferric-dicitrate binding protein FerR (iron transport regulator)
MTQNRAYILLSRKLNGEANDSEIRELNDLIEQDPELRHAARIISEYWASPQKTDEEFLEATYLLHLSRMKAAGVEINTLDNLLDDATPEIFSQPQRKKKLLLWSIPLFIIAVIAGWLYFSNLSHKPRPIALAGNNQISTRNGSRTKINLPDGSTVWLNAGSKLEYDKTFGNTLREVHLSGEAYFDVVKNSGKPFIVNTKSAKVKVLGTAFNVRSYPEDNKIETSLIHGSVEVTLNKRPDQKWVLKPNEKLVLLNDYVTPQPKKRVTEVKSIKIPEVAITKLTYLPGENTAVETAWTYNKLVFEDEIFAEVSKQMARWYDVQFVFKTKELENRMVHGTFTTETIHQAMEALQYSFKFRYEIKNKTVTIY